MPIKVDDSLVRNSFTIQFSGKRKAASSHIKVQWNLHITDTSRTNFSSVVERCPLYGGVTFCHSVFWDENICPLFGGVRCIEVSVNGGSTVFYILATKFACFVNNLILISKFKMMELVSNYIMQNK